MPWAAVEERLPPPSTEGTRLAQDAIVEEYVCGSARYHTWDFGYIKGWVAYLLPII
jgi:hypothetical protein